MSDTNARLSHEIAARTARQLIHEATAAGLPWADIAISCETVVAIVVSAICRIEQRDGDLRYATELIETITERAHSRAAHFILGSL